MKNIPRTRFNGKVTPHRVFDAINIPLDEVKAIKNAVPGATVNDAAINIIDGALRTYLQAHNELPEESLATSCRKMKPGTAFYRNCLQQSFEKLRDACGAGR